MTDFRVINSEGVEVLVIDLPKINGVHHLLTNSEFEALKKHFEGFIKYREDQNELEKDQQVIQDLPFSKNDNAWRNKQFTVNMLSKHVQIHQPKKALIIGSGNGWLCNKLSFQGVSCLGIDILYYPYDGLETITQYKTEFTHLLMHPHEVQRLKNKFDLIVFENNLPYVKNYIEALEDAKSMLASRGHIYLTGISLHSGGVQKEKKRISQMQKYFTENYNHQINTYDTDMFLEVDALNEIRKAGFTVRFRPQLKNRIKRLLKFSVVNCDAVLTKS